MKIRHQPDAASGLLFIVIGAGFAAGALQYDFGSSAQPGPGYLPFGLGVLLALLGLVVLAGAVAPRTARVRVGPFAWRPLLATLGAVTLFGLAVPHLGLGLTIPLLVLVSSLAGDDFDLRTALLNALVLTVASGLIFVRGLHLNVPFWPPALAS